MDKAAKIYVAGHRGLAGSAILRQLKAKGYQNLVLRTMPELDLTNQQATAKFFASEKPEYVFLAAAKVGGIMANMTYPAQFIYENLQIQNDVIHNSYIHGVKKLLFLGSSCIYPKNCPQPMKEEYLLTGPLEPTNEPYALAKIAGIKMCQSYNRQYKTNFIAAMPTNLYGLNDNFDLQTSHVFAALLRKFHEAKSTGQKEVVLWGSGQPLREFLSTDDMAEACIFLMNRFDPTPEQNESGEIFLNVGSGEEISIAAYAELVKEIVGFKGSLKWDPTKPDGTARKIMDSARLHKLGWRHQTSIKDGAKMLYEWFISNVYEQSQN